MCVCVLFGLRGTTKAGAVELTIPLCREHHRGSMCDTPYRYWHTDGHKHTSSSSSLETCVQNQLTCLSCRTDDRRLTFLCGQWSKSDSGKKVYFKSAKVIVKTAKKKMSIQIRLSTEKNLCVAVCKLTSLCIVFATRSVGFGPHGNGLSRFQLILIWSG